MWWGFDTGNRNIRIEIEIIHGLKLTWWNKWLTHTQRRTSVIPQHMSRQRVIEQESIPVCSLLSTAEDKEWYKPSHSDYDYKKNRIFIFTFQVIRVSN